MKKISLSHLIVIFFLAQALAFGLITQNLQINQITSNTTIVLMYAVSTINVIFALILARKFFLSQFYMQLLRKQDQQLSNLNFLVKTVRAQRHDMINQMQAVFGLLEQNKLENAQNYLDEIKSETQNNSNLLLLKDPEITAFLQRKINQAVSQQTALDLEINSDIGTTPIKPYHFNKILGNLIDNALEAVQNIPPNKRQCWLEIFENTEEFTIIVSNTGPPISENLTGKIFEPGISTKGEDRGLGLAIVKDIVTQFGGSVKCTPNPVSFTLKIPKNKGVFNDT